MNGLQPILLVEDNANDVELTLLAFSKHKLANRIDVVHDGEEAIEYLKRTGKFQDRAPVNPSVVLLDIKMPKVNGLEVLRIIKTDPGLKIIPVVMLTSSKDDNDLMSSYRLGANAYIVKPVDFHEFVEAIKHIGVFWAILNTVPECT